MTADVTPTQKSTSTLLNVASDEITKRYGEILVTSTTAQAASVNTTGEAMFGGRPIIFKSAYAAPAGSSSTYPAVGVIPAYTITRVCSSAPVTLVSMTQYHNVVSTNTTVWNVTNSPSSLLLAAPGSGDDVVSYKVALVCDTVV
jgi:hypothetical protein